MTLSQRCVFGLAMGCALLFAGGLTAQDPDYTLTVSSAGPVPTLTPVEITFTIDNSGEPLLGYQWGICHDEAVLSIGEDGSNVVQGSALDDIDFTFEAVTTSDDPDGDLFGAGWTVGSLFNVITATQLPPGDDLEMYVGTYTTLAGAPDGITVIEPCETLNDPAVNVRVIIALPGGGNDEVQPTTVAGEVEVGEPPAVYLLNAGEVTGAQGTQVEVPVLLSTPEEGGADAFSFGATHDGSLVTMVSVEVGAGIEAINDGDGPDFFGVAVAPNAADGGTVGCVLSFGDSGPFTEIAADTTGVEICRLVYDISAGAPQDSTSAIDFDGGLGTPQVPNVISYLGQSFDPMLDSGEILIQGIPVPIFVRGDANGDGGVDISDPFFLALFLFDGGDAVTCEDAGDADNDEVLGLLDAMYLLEYLFLSEPAPEAPFPDCGPDDDDETLQCAESQVLTCP